MFRQWLENMENMESIQTILQRITQQMCSAGSCPPCEINKGLCDDWANEVFEELLKMDIDVEIWSTADWGQGYAHKDDHVFLKIDNKFYDAEESNGVAKAEQLPFYQRLGKMSPIVQIG